VAKKLLGIGLLLGLELKDPDTGRIWKVATPKRWLAWDVSKKSFWIVKPLKDAEAPLPSSVVKAHKRFHNASPTRVLACEATDNPKRKMRFVGLLRGLAYHVPKTVISPSKKMYVWNHAMGDTGHRGGDDYPEKLMPAVYFDGRDYRIIRRPGNIFRVTDWLRG
jgi:hypothetical protein